jgi:predicted nucleotidyltransferase
MSKSTYKTEWEYEDDWGGTSRLLLRIDDESSEQEIEDEIEYWMTQIMLFEIEGAQRKAIMAFIRWTQMLLELR